MDIKRKIKYYWVRFKMEMQGGYKEIKRIYDELDVIEDIKAVFKRWDEEEAYERQQRIYRNKPLLHKNDIVEFRQPDFKGNIIKGRVNEICYVPLIGREIQIEILETGLRMKDDYICYDQEEIMNNLINLEKVN